MNFVWMNGNDVYMSQSQNEHTLGTTAIDPVFYENTIPPLETLQSRIVSNIFFIYLIILPM